MAYSFDNVILYFSQFGKYDVIAALERFMYMDVSGYEIM